MNIILTGVSKGLGLEVAKILLEKNFCVFGISRTKTSELDELMREHPAKIKWLKYDLNNTQNVKEVIFKEFIGFETKVDAFINNAAIAYDDIITNLSTETLEEMFRINVFTPMVVVKYAIRHMLLHSTKGSIVHISSISAHTGYKGLAMYAATKAALEAFSKNTAREWGEKGIRSNCVVPGFMETDMSSSLDQVQKNRIFSRNSLKSSVNIKSVAETVCYLISNKSNSITGQNIFVDNGTI